MKSWFVIPALLLMISVSSLCQVSLNSSQGTLNRLMAKRVDLLAKQVTKNAALINVLLLRMERKENAALDRYCRECEKDAPDDDKLGKMWEDLTPGHKRLLELVTGAGGW